MFAAMDETPGEIEAGVERRSFTLCPDIAGMSLLGGAPGARRWVTASEASAAAIKLTQRVLR